jgi:lysozyme family protein
LADFQKALPILLQVEGGYVNDPDDPGKETNFGVTVDTARKYGYTGDMKKLTKEKAEEIYRMGYWNTCRLDDFSGQKIAEFVFDCNVNHGGTMGAVFLQRSLNVLNTDPKGRVVWPVIAVDGKVGNLTLSALEIALKSRKNMEELILKTMNCIRGAFFVEIAERREKSKKFMYGWMGNRIFID